MRKTLLAALMLMQLGAWAKVELPEILSDNMVLQQQTEVKLWGKAKANAEVSICPSWTNSVLGCPVRCSEKQMLKSPIKLQN